MFQYILRGQNHSLFTGAENTASDGCQWMGLSFVIFNLLRFLAFRIVIFWTYCAMKKGVDKCVPNAFKNHSTLNMQMQLSRGKMSPKCARHRAHSAKWGEMGQGQINATR